MIFISHNYKDKAFVGHIADKIANIYGRSNVFYDSWSIQPGEGIIDRMNDGIESVKIFFFFVTENSLKSNMVSLEWQNALMKAATGDVKFVAIRCDESPMPALLTQKVYLDLYTNGVDVVIAQMNDIISGKSTYKPQDELFSNLTYDFKTESNKIIVKVSADHFSEVTADFLFLFTNKLNDNELRYNVLGESGFIQGFRSDCKLNTGDVFSAQMVALMHGLKPKIHLTVEFWLDTGDELNLAHVMSKTSTDQYTTIPYKKKSDFSGFNMKF